MQILVRDDPLIRYDIEFDGSLKEAFQALFLGKVYRVTLEWKKWLLIFTRRRPWIRPRRIKGG